MPAEQLETLKLVMSPNVAQAIISLTVSLLNKGNPLKFRLFFQTVVSLSSHLVAWSENYKRSFRKQGVVKNLIKLTKEILVVQL